MYPLSNLQQIKDENFQQEFSELQNKTAELERYHNFAQVNELIDEIKNIMASEKNVGAITEYNKKIDDLIKKLTQPIQEKFSHLAVLNELIEKYCDQGEVQSLNSALAIQEKKLKAEIANDSINPREIENNLSKIDSISHRNLKKILVKIKQSLSETSWDGKYKNYLDSQIDLLSISEKEINEKSAEIAACFDIIKFVIKSITGLETSHEYFTNLAKNFNLAEECFNELTHTLVNSNAVNFCKDQVEQKIKILSNEFTEFDPKSMSLDHLNLRFFELNQKLNELHQLNQNELQDQKDTFIRLIEDSKQDLTDYAKKLSLLKSKCAHNKSEQLQIIIQKIDLLLNPEINIEENASKREITPDKILDLKETLKNANSLLSEYRGISLLRCFATLWGGGRVTSQLLVNKLENQLTDLQTSMSRLSPHS